MAAVHNPRCFQFSFFCRSTVFYFFLWMVFWGVSSGTDIASAATKGVRVAPTRVVFQDRVRSQIVRLINTNETACKYRISLVNLKMDEFGNRTAVEDPTPEELALHQMIRFSPRSVTVAPGGWQTVRLMVKKPRNLNPGEYRIHLKVSPVPDSSPGPTASDSTREKLGIQINYIFAITIPVIIRHGRGDVRVTPRSVALERSEKDRHYFLETELEREGLFSAYGNVVAFHTPMHGGERIKVAELKGISIYTPNRRQTLRIPVLIEKPLSLNRGTLDIEVVNLEDKALPLLGSKKFHLKGF